jgi:tRNA pseudouridine55 synthase
MINQINFGMTTIYPPFQSGVNPLNDGFIVNINKPKGWSSFDVVRKVRSVTNIKKIGHAGTLDPFATGVLLICIGKATKQVSELQTLPKTYEAILKLGTGTDTLDLTGKTIKKEKIPNFDETDLARIFKELTGSIKQRIPDFSASKVGGRRSYSLARKGKKLPERYKQVDIYSIEFISRTPSEIHFSVECSTGTFVRTLGLDIAKKLGTTGHLISLIRKSIGNYTLKEALTPEQFSGVWNTITKDENIQKN